MRFCVLGSGSKGNSTYVESQGKAILIDAGFSGIEIQRRLDSIGVDINTIQALLVTHEHGDHISGVGVLSRKLHIPVFINKPTLAASGKTLSKLHAVREFQTGTSFKFCHFNIHPFAISHDTADPVGFTIIAARSVIGYCTDTGMISKLITHHLSRCNALVLECNHDLEMLRNGHYPPSLQQRIRSKNGHLANPDTIKFLGDVINPHLRHVVLAHISESNNCAEIVQAEVAAFLRSQAIGSCPTITLANQNKPGKLIGV
jgi:phosphoribosyl 1,2-cyclic phosphodiesterase